MTKFNELKELLETLTADADKFFTKGNKSAGTRLRKGMQAVKKLAQEVRVSVSDVKTGTSSDVA